MFASTKGMRTLKLAIAAVAGFLAVTLVLHGYEKVRDAADRAH